MIYKGVLGFVNLEISDDEMDKEDYDAKVKRLTNKLVRCQTIEKNIKSQLKKLVSKPFIFK